MLLSSEKTAGIIKRLHSFLFECVVGYNIRTFTLEIHYYQTDFNYFTLRVCIILINAFIFIFKRKILYELSLSRLYVQQGYVGNSKSWVLLISLTPEFSDWPTERYSRAMEACRPYCWVIVSAWHVPTKSLETHPEKS